MIRSASILNIPIDKNAASEIAGRSRGTPRIANALLRRVRDFAQVKGNGKIDLEITKYALDALNIDKRGLDLMDNKILTTIIDNIAWFVALDYDFATLLSLVESTSCQAA